jgi:hypothetical protein
MTDLRYAAGIAAGVALLGLVLELVRRRKLVEEYSFPWIVGSLLLVFVALRQDVLGIVAHWAGVSSPGVVLVLVLVAMLIVLSLFVSVVMSRQRRQIETLMEETAVLSAELRDLRAAQETRDEWGSPGDQVSLSAGPNRPRA